MPMVRARVGVHAPVRWASRSARVINRLRLTDGHRVRGAGGRLATLGTHGRSMSPADVTAFIQGEQQTWNPVFQRIARSP